MKHFILISLLIGGITGYSQNSVVPVTRFYWFTGTIDKYPVTFLLHRINDDFTGCYYYENSGVPIEVAGRFNHKGFLELSHDNPEGTEYETMEGPFTDSTFSATWRSYNNKLRLEIAQPAGPSTLTFDYIWTYGSQKIKDKKNLPSHIEELSYDAKTVWPKAASSHPSKQLVQQVIRELLGEKNSSEEPGKIMLRHKNKFLNPSSEDELIELESSEAINIEFADNRIICLAQTWSNYTGGAHGLYGTNYENIDLQNNRRLKLSDIIDTIAAKKTLEKLLEKEFLKKFPLEKDEKIADVLLVEKITATENFALNGKSIAFNYDPYEIAAYVYGQINLVVPYKQIQPFLNPRFKKLMGL
jgi:hypothetical protein